MAAKSIFAETIRLLQAASAGDTGAIHALLEKYHDKIHRMARIRMGRKLRTKMESRDIVQESMLKALESVQSGRDGGKPKMFESEGEFIGWLYSIVKSRVADQIRYHDADKRRASRQTPLDSTVGRNAVDAAQGRRTAPDKKWDDEILLESMLDQLSEDDREVVVERDIQRYSFGEMADRRSIKEDAMRMRHKRIMAKLASMVPDES